MSPAQLTAWCKALLVCAACATLSACGGGSDATEPAPAPAPQKSCTVDLTFGPYSPIACTSVPQLP